MSRSGDTGIRVPARFNGPPDSANGGYACGLLAAEIGGEAVEVTLRSPPPLERDLVQVGEPHVLVSWELGRDGRKRNSAGAVFDPRGRPLAYSRALWIELKPGPWRSI